MPPLATVSATSITSLVRMTLYHHSISGYDTKVETNKGVAAWGEKARSAAAENPATRLVSDIPGVRSAKTRMAIEEAKSE